MNKWLICGRLTRKPEIRYTADKKMPVASFTVAVDRKFKAEGAEQTADFIPCKAFNKTAEFVEKYFDKGSKIIVEGHGQSGNYTNKEGHKVYTLDLMVENVEFAESKSAAGGSQTTDSVKENEGFIEAPSDVEELPFA